MDKDHIFPKQKKKKKKKKEEEEERERERERESLESKDVNFKKKKMMKKS